MALESLGPDDLTGAGYVESFGGGTIGFHFGHYEYPPLTQKPWRRSSKTASPDKNRLVSIRKHPDGTPAVSDSDLSDKDSTPNPQVIERPAKSVEEGEFYSARICRPFY
jgi:hypothetical protein